MAKMNPGCYDYREIACPHNGCAATVGHYCKRPSGHSGPFVQPHQARRQAAQQKWQQEKLELYGRIVTDWTEEEAEQTPPAPARQLSLF